MAVERQRFLVGNCLSAAPTPLCCIHLHVPPKAAFAQTRTLFDAPSSILRRTIACSAVAAPRKTGARVRERAVGKPVAAPLPQERPHQNGPAAAVRRRCERAGKLHTIQTN